MHGSKLNTFDHALKSLKAKIFLVQEVKQQSVGNIKTEYLKNFQLFELVREEERVAGGGLMIGVDKELKSLQVGKETTRSSACLSWWLYRGQIYGRFVDTARSAGIQQRGKHSSGIISIVRLS